MRRTTVCIKAQNRGQAGRRIGLLFGSFMLLGSAQLLGSENPVQASAQQSCAPKPPVRVLVVSIPDRKLAVTQDGRVLSVYSVAVGASESPSPTGRMTIISKVVNPTYYHRGKVIAPGKSNPLGDRWIGLSEKGYGIHGTNAPSSIGHAVSHGCIRMSKRDVENLFNLVRVGDAAEIHGTRDEKVAEIFSDCRNSVGDCRLKEDVPVPGLPSSTVNGQAAISKLETQAEGN